MGITVEYPSQTTAIIMFVMSPSHQGDTTISMLHLQKELESELMWLEVKTKKGLSSPGRTIAVALIQTLQL